MSTVRAALTETKNAFADMPTRVEDLDRLAPRLDELRQANIDHHLELMARAKDLGVEIIGFGELFAGPYFAITRHRMWQALAENARSGPTISQIRKAARRHKMFVVAPIYEIDDQTGRRFNTAVVIDDAGEILGSYRKTHIPQGTNEVASFHEAFYYERSDGRMGVPAPNPFFPAFTTRLGTIGVAICYDRHFDGVIASLSQSGAQLVFCPAVTFGEKSRRMWPQEFAVDAMRHHVFIGGSNRRGAEPPWNVEFFGESHFVGPDGPLPNLSPIPELVVSDVPLAKLREADSSGWNLRRDVGHDIYTPRWPR